MKLYTDNCLQNVNPQLAREWHPTKNGSLTPKDVTAGLRKKVWWKCKKGHVWHGRIADRSHGSGCPCCSGRKVCADNCLKTMNPQLAKEWHPTKNGALTPKDITAGSDKKVWWKCKTGHIWQARIASRNRGHGCPRCSREKMSTERKLSDDNCLKAINPELAKEWHPTKNGSLTPKDVTAGSGKRVWWKCKKGHVWEAKVYIRNSGYGCPYCSGRKACTDNCLKTINPQLAKEWHSTKNGSLTPKDVTVNTGKKVWWKCKKGHEWKATIISRNRGYGCPYCLGRKVCADNCLKTINPQLAKQWHPTKNGSLTPKNVTANSNKKAWWKCKKGHIWEARINNRNRGYGCPYCSGNKKQLELFPELD